MFQPYAPENSIAPRITGENPEAPRGGIFVLAVRLVQKREKDAYFARRYGHNERYGPQNDQSDSNVH